VRVYLETERLVLRELTAADADVLVALDGDPAVMRFLTGGVATPRGEVTDRLLPRLLDEYTRWPGLGRWAAVERSSGEFAGWLALAPAAPGEAELGYRLRRAVWGRGLASEGARALVRHAFAVLGLRRVWAQTMAVNTASRRVMEHAGLRYVRTFHPHFDDPIPGTEHGEVEYALPAGQHFWLT
jgi:RimJ/RimL family protein N-acetyltransferase